MQTSILGYDSDRENPYWVGICDIGKGMSFSTAEQLVDAPIYNGKSLKQRWSNVRINSIEGVSVKEWLELFVDGGVTRRKVSQFIWCPYCDQGYIRRALVKSTKEMIYICEECDTIWRTYEDIFKDRGIGYYLYADEKGFEPLWNELQLCEQ